MKNKIINAINHFGPYFFECKDWEDDPCTPENNIHNHTSDDLRCNIEMTILYPSGEIRNILNAISYKSIPDEWKHKLNLLESVKLKEK